MKAGAAAVVEGIVVVEVVSVVVVENVSVFVELELAGPAGPGVVVTVVASYVVEVVVLTRQVVI
jgi:hypothetical protein